MAMSEREKAIKGLESLHKRLLDAAAQDRIAMLDANMVSDALALLKAQEPRVMTLEEVKQFVFGAPYIIETNEPDNESRMMYGLYSHQGLEGNFDFAVTDMRKRLFDIDYGKTWRCWTSRPTYEQRKAVKWDDA